MFRSSVMLKCLHDRLCDLDTSSEDTGVEGLSVTQWYDTANNCAPVSQVLTTDDLGNITITWLDKDGNEMTDSSNFTPAKPNVENEHQRMYATNTVSTDAEFGRVVELNRTDTYTDGVLDPTATQYWDVTQHPNVDVTAIVTAAPYSLASAPIREQLGSGTIVIDAANPAGDVNLGAEIAIAANAATYVEIYIDAGGTGDGNIRWTKDGTAPADNNGEQENAGSTIKLWDRPEIDNFMAAAIDAAGLMDPTGGANLKWTAWNVDPHDD